MTERRWEKACLVALWGFCLLFVVASNLSFMARNQVYAALADSFAHGRLDVASSAVIGGGFVDMVTRDGKYYWPSGTLPALVLVPAVLLFGPHYEFQAMLQVLLAFALAWVSYRLARKLGHDALQAGWLSLAFLFGSVAVGVVGANTPWLLAGSMAALLLLLACHESAGKNRPAEIGALVGLAMLSRITAGLGLLYFIVLEMSGAGKRKPSLRRLVLLCAPFVVSAALLGTYNHLRFGTWSDTGLATHSLQPGIEEASREKGSFRLANVPRNAYAYFVQLPDIRNGLPVANPYGLSFFLLSPFFLFLLAADRKSRTFVGAVAVSVPALAVFLTYFTTGYLQFGPRYLLDIHPFWYVVLIETFRKRPLGTAQKWLIGASALANIVLFLFFVAYFTLTKVSFAPLIS